jgi:hypothetical protein
MVAVGLAFSGAICECASALVLTSRLLLHIQMDAPLIP